MLQTGRLSSIAVSRGLAAEASLTWRRASSPTCRIFTWVCDEVRCAGDHVAYFWTFTGTHAATKRPLRVVGWEEWDLDADFKIMASRGWYDAAEYERRQTTAR